MKLITLGALVIILVMINILFRKVLGQIKKRNSALDYAKRYLPVMEMMGWSLLIIWLVNIQFTGSNLNLYFRLVIILLVTIFVSWYILRDLIAGVQVKTRFNLVKGQRLFYDKIQGEIKKLGLLAMSIKEDDGSDLVIPYANINQKEIRLNYLEEGDSEARFAIDLDSKYEEKETIERLMEIINNSAWCSHKSKPHVQVIDETKNTKQYEITFKPNVSDGAKKLKSMILSIMNE